MPHQDGTGPCGKGPKTGRGLGACIGVPNDQLFDQPFENCGKRKVGFFGRTFRRSPRGRCGFGRNER